VTYVPIVVKKKFKVQCSSRFYSLRLFKGFAVQSLRGSNARERWGEKKRLKRKNATNITNVTYVPGVVKKSSRFNALRAFNGESANEAT